jgi:biotin operon repressor
MSPPDLPDYSPLVTLFKALGDESRLRIVGLLAARPRAVEELASELALSASTVSHHLTRLRDAGLVQSDRDQYYQVYRFVPERLHDVAKVLLQKEAIAIPPSHDEAERYRQEVLGNFLVEGRLTKIPAQRKKREVILEFLADQFEPGRRYPEKEVNALIQRYHEDFCTLRRELIMGRLLKREAGVYWREAA